MEAPFKLTGEQPHTTVLLSSTFSEDYKPFHCVSCGNIAFSYNEDEVRTILPGGHPQLDRPGKIYQCNGIMHLYGRTRAYDLLHEVLSAAMNVVDIEDLRVSIAYLTKDSEVTTNARCKMLYFVS